MRTMLKMWLVAVVAVLWVNGTALADEITLGQQDFDTDQFLSFTGYEGEQSGEGDLHLFQGNDLVDGSVFDVEMFFDLDSGPVPQGNGGSGPITSASLTFGIFDHDSAGDGSQLASFTLNESIDLTVDLDALFESRGGRQTAEDGAEYNIYTIDIPTISLSALESGVASFRLTLSGPSIVTVDGFDPIGPGNGAGLDFATFVFSSVSVPEPGTAALLGFALLGLAARRRRS